MQMQRARQMLIVVHCLDQKTNIPLTCWRMTTQQQQWSKLNESTKKLIHLERTKKREWQRIMQTLMSKTQLSNNMEITQKPKTIQDTVQHCHKGNNNEKQIAKNTKEISPPKSGKSKIIPQKVSMTKEIPNSGQKPICQGC